MINIYYLKSPSEIESIPSNYTHYVDLNTDIMYKKVDNVWEKVERNNGE